MSEKGKLPRKRIVIQKEKKRTNSNVQREEKIELNVVWNFMQPYAVYRKEGTNGVP